MTTTQRWTPPPALTGRQIREMQQKLEGMPELQATSELFRVVANPTRLKLLFLLHRGERLTVTQWAATLDISASALSQHLESLRDHGLVARERQAQRFYYRLTDHPFNEKLRRNFF